MNEDFVDCRTCDLHRAEIRREMSQKMETQSISLKYELSQLIDSRMEKLEKALTLSSERRTEQSNKRHDQTDEKLSEIAQNQAGFERFVKRVTLWILTGVILILIGVICGRGLDYFMVMM